MSKYLIALDTETTGLKDPSLVELAYRVLPDGKPVVLRCKPDKPIEIGAMMVNHITNEMVDMLLPFQEMPAYAEIKETIENGIVLAHNAPFDIKVLAKEGINVREYIDTKEIAETTYPDAEMHRLQYLRYYLNLKTDGGAHTAAGDIEVLELLWGALSHNFEAMTITKWKHTLVIPSEVVV